MAGAAASARTRGDGRLSGVGLPPTAPFETLDPVEGPEWRWWAATLACRQVPQFARLGA
jgi:hypothetical protein